MKKIIEIPHITAIASSNAWKPITPFGTVSITEEKKYDQHEGDCQWTQRKMEI